MSDQNQFVDENPAGFNNEPAGDYKEYSRPTQANETPKTDPETSSKFGAEILSILEGFGEDIKRLSKSVTEYIDKESFGKAAESVKDALSDAGEGLSFAKHGGAGRRTSSVPSGIEGLRKEDRQVHQRPLQRRTSHSPQDLKKTWREPRTT